MGDGQPVQRFLLFSGVEDAKGGWDDFSGDFSRLAVARVAFARSDHDWAHVLDGDGLTIVARWYKRGGDVVDADQPSGSR